MSRETRIECRDLALSVSEYLDGEVQDPLRGQIDLHKDECQGCRHLITSLSRTIEGIRGQPREEAPVRVKELLAETMRRARGDLS